jgi:hypothetical protein
MIIFAFITNLFEVNLRDKEGKMMVSFIIYSLIFSLSTILGGGGFSYRKITKNFIFAFIFFIILDFLNDKLLSKLFLNTLELPYNYNVVIVLGFLFLYSIYISIKAFRRKE